MELWEILVPTKYGDNEKPIRTKHHKNWDSYVRGVAGGLTLLTPQKGQWVYQDKLIEERVIPVKIACTRKQIDTIIEFTLTHYRQKAVMAYKLSDEVIIRKGKENAEER